MAYNARPTLEKRTPLARLKLLDFLNLNRLQRRRHAEDGIVGFYRE
jgi:hypothetical protein